VKEILDFILRVFRKEYNIVFASNFFCCEAYFARDTRSQNLKFVDSLAVS
jgi:hypothetical protein